MDTELLKLVLSDATNDARNELDESLAAITMYCLGCSAIISRDAKMLRTLRMALSRDCAVQCIDYPNQHGLTLLQHAAYWVNSDVVRLLLDAGADAEIPFLATDERLEAPVPILPLELVCWSGWNGSNTDLKQGEEGWSLADIWQTNAFEVARELLRWHEARGDGLFEGITELHLAYLVFNEDEVRRLVRSGYSKTAKGSWPGMKGKFTPDELMTPVLRRVRDVSVHLHTVVTKLSKPQLPT